MKKILFIICCLISLNVLANTDSMLLEQQMNVLKSMGVNNPELMDTLSTMQKDFADDDASENQNRQTVQATYFSTAGHSDLEKCATGEVQLDTICQAAMLRYQAYLSAISANESEQNINAFYSQHAEAAKHYIAVHESLTH